jgi:hypothetical protein
LVLNTAIHITALKNAQKIDNFSAIIANEITEAAIGIAVIAPFAPDKCNIPMAATFDRVGGNAGPPQKCRALGHFRYESHTQIAFDHFQQGVQAGSSKAVNLVQLTDVAG